MDPIIETLLRGSLISLAGLLITLAAWKSSASTRSRILAWTILALALLPLVVFSGARWHVLPAASSNTVTEIPQTIVPTPNLVSTDTTSTYRSQNNTALHPTNKHAISWPSILLGLYVTGIIVSWLPSLVAMNRLRRLRKSSNVCSNRRLQEFASAIAPSLPNQLRISPDNHVPMTWGVFRPIVLLPESAQEWPESRLTAVLNHEHGHIRRRDALVMALAQAVRSIYWPQPLVWWLVQRWHTSAEFACDDHALEEGSQAEDYAAALYNLAKEQSGGTPIALPMATGHALEARVKAVLNPNRNNHAKGVIVTIAALILSACLATVAEEKQPSKSGEDRQPVKEALRTIILPKVSIRNATPAEAVDAVRELIAIHDKRDLPEDKKSVQISIPPQSLTNKVSLEFRSVPALVSLEYLAELIDARVAFKSNVAIFIPTTEDSTDVAKSPNIIRMVDEAWEVPVAQVEGTKDNGGNVEDSLRAIAETLGQTVIPQCKFDNLTLEEAISELKDLSVAHDLRDVPPNRKGINMLVDARKIQATNPEAMQARVTLDLRNVPVIELLKYVTKLAGVAYRLEPYAVVIVPTNEDASALYTRRYAVTDEMARSKLSGKDYLKRFDVKFPEGATAFLILRNNKLVVRNTADQLDRIDQIVRTMNTQAKRRELQKISIAKFAVTNATLPEAVAQLRTTLGAVEGGQVKIIVDTQSLQSRSADSLTLRATMSFQDTSLTNLFDQLGEEFGIAVQFEMYAVKLTAANTP